MKYFLHDTNAFQDEKITELYIQFGYEGVGLFFTILEKIALQEKPVKTVVLKKQLHVGKKLEKCWEFMESLELIYSNNGETFNENILKFSEKYQIKKEKNKERVSQWRKNQGDTKNVTRYERVSNARKDNISKGKESNKEKATPYNAKASEDFFLNTFNSLTGKDHRVLPAKVKASLRARVVTDGYTSKDFIQAIKNCMDDKYHRETNLKYLTPEFITRADKLEMYLTKKTTATTGTPELPKTLNTLEELAEYFGGGLNPNFKEN